MGQKTFKFMPQHLLNIITEGFEYSMKCTKGIPRGARFISVDSSDGMFNITVEHPSFVATRDARPVTPVLDECQFVSIRNK